MQIIHMHYVLQKKTEKNEMSLLYMEFTKKHTKSYKKWPDIVDHATENVSTERKYATNIARMIFYSIVISLLIPGLQ